MGLKTGPLPSRIEGNADTKLLLILIVWMCLFGGKKKMSVGMTLWAPTGRSKWQVFFLSLLYAKRLQEKHYGQPKGFYYSLKSAEAPHPEASTHSPVILSQKRL